MWENLILMYSLNVRFEAAVLLSLLINYLIILATARPQRSLISRHWSNAVILPNLAVRERQSYCVFPEVLLTEKKEFYFNKFMVFSVQILRYLSITSHITVRPSADWDTCIVKWTVSKERYIIPFLLTFRSFLFLLIHFLCSYCKASVFFLFLRARQHVCPGWTAAKGLLCNPEHYIKHRFSSAVPLIKRQRFLT
jgi:hypothetical protein